MDDEVRHPAIVGFEPIEHVHEHGPVLAAILRQLSWSKKRCLGARGSGSRGNLGIIGRATHARDERHRPEAGLNRVRYQWPSAEQLQVLTENTLRTATRGHHREHPHLRLRAHWQPIITRFPFCDTPVTLFLAV